MENDRHSAPFLKRFRKGFRQWMAVLPFIGISLILFTVFSLYPQIKNIYIALTDYNIMPGTPHPFVGLRNFQKIFTDIGTEGSDASFFLAFLPEQLPGGRHHGSGPADSRRVCGPVDQPN
jgi:ABC-type sugar transport system permease subunit